MSEKQAEYKAKEFDGFDIPKQNWSKLPHQFIEALPIVDSLSEMKVILYILRHTWGFQEFDSLKKITLDEFENGRVKKDRTRLDNGIGMSKSSIIRGLNKAEEHGFIIIEEDNRDKARKKRMYRIATSEVSKQYIKGIETIHRTEKDTLEEKPKKEKQTIEEIVAELEKHEELEKESDGKNPRAPQILQAMAEGMGQQLDIKAAFAEHLGLTPPWDYKSNQEHYQFFRAEADSGRHVKQFADWWFENDWRGKDNQSPTINQVRTMWLQAFKNNKPKKTRKKIRIINPITGQIEEATT